MSLKIVHWSLWAPNRSGLDAFVRDQIRIERSMGLDSILVLSEIESPDPNRHSIPELTAQPWSDAWDADVWVLHRAIPSHMFNSKKAEKIKKIAVLHGTNEIMMLHEVESDGVNAKFKLHLDFVDQFDKTVAITKWDYEIMQQYDNGRNKVEYISDAVDTDYYTPVGHRWEYRYHPAIVSTTNIRINKNPSPLIWSMPRIKKLIPTARLNLFCMNFGSTSTWENLILRSNEISSCVENAHNKFNDLRPFMRGGEISFNSNYNGVFSRDSMESLACGMSVVAFTDEHTQYVCTRSFDSIASAVKHAWDDFLENDFEGQISKNRAYAEEHFSMKKIVMNGYIPLYEGKSLPKP